MFKPPRCERSIPSRQHQLRQCWESHEWSPHWALTSRNWEVPRFRWLGRPTLCQCTIKKIRWLRTQVTSHTRSASQKKVPCLAYAHNKHGPAFNDLVDLRSRVSWSRCLKPPPVATSVPLPVGVIWTSSPPATVFFPCQIHQTSPNDLRPGKSQKPDVELFPLLIPHVSNLEMNVPAS